MRITPQIDDVIRRSGECPVMTAISGLETFPTSACQVDYGAIKDRDSQWKPGGSSEGCAKYKHSNVQKDHKSGQEIRRQQKQKIGRTNRFANPQKSQSAEM
jgi:hypothetical protein